MKSTRGAGSQTLIAALLVIVVVGMFGMAVAWFAGWGPFAATGGTVTDAGTPQQPSISAQAIGAASADASFCSDQNDQIDLRINCGDKLATSATVRACDIIIAKLAADGKGYGFVENRTASSTSVGSFTTFSSVFSCAQLDADKGGQGYDLFIRDSAYSAGNTAGTSGIGQPKHIRFAKVGETPDVAAGIFPKAKTIDFGSMPVVIQSDLVARAYSAVDNGFYFPDSGSALYADSASAYHNATALGSTTTTMGQCDLNFTSITNATIKEVTGSYDIRLDVRMNTAGTQYGEVFGVAVDYQQNGDTNASDNWNADSISFTASGEFRDMNGNRKTISGIPLKDITGEINDNDKGSAVLSGYEKVYALVDESGNYLALADNKEGRSLFFSITAEGTNDAAEDITWQFLPFGTYTDDKNPNSEVRGFDRANGIKQLALTRTDSSRTRIATTEGSCVMQHLN